MSERRDAWVRLNRRERQGFLLLAFLCLLTGLIPELRSVVRESGQGAEPSVEVGPSPDSLVRPPAPPSVERFPFDPNTVDSAALRALGFSKRGARNLLSYRRAGGRFSKPDDLAKIYGLRSSLFDSLKPFVRIEEPAPRDTLPTLHPHPFDPNRVSADALRSMGLPRKVAETWVRYRKAGGYFNEASSLHRIYGMREAWYQQLEPYLRFSEPTDSLAAARMEAALREKHFPEETERLFLDINTASREEWESLWGIGPVLAGRILRFREALGGFYSPDQLAQTYGLPDSTFRRLRDRLQLQTSWRRWQVNHLGADSLARHPYLNGRQARALVAYRAQHGPFRQASDLRALHILADSTINKLEPYLSFDRD